MKIKTATLLVALLSVAASTAALSQNSQGQNDNDQGWNSGARRSVRAPEISPAEAMGALALLGGAVAIVRGYRRRQK
jgi:Spy/CpxP family protein refolding chaperone